MPTEPLDLDAVAATLLRELGGRAPEGFVRGRTVLRDCVVANLRCSQLEAERIVDTMVGRGFLRYSGEPASADGAGSWLVRRADD